MKLEAKQLCSTHLVALFLQDLKKQAEDVDMLIERMDEQVKQLTKAYRDELEEIEVFVILIKINLLTSKNSGYTSGRLVCW